MEVTGQLHAPAALPPGERAPGTHWIGALVDPRVCLDAVEIRQNRTLAVQSVARLYTDLGIPAPIQSNVLPPMFILPSSRISYKLLRQNAAEVSVSEHSVV
jgi:hypothetical protein